MEELYNKEDLKNPWFKEVEWKIWISIFYPDYAEELIERYCKDDKTMK